MISIVIGNLVRGFEVITGFESDDQAHDFIGNNRDRVGSEYRLAPTYSPATAVQPTKDTILQDALEFEAEKPGEMIEPSTGASIDIQPKPVEEEDNAPERPDLADQGQTGNSGSLSSGDSPELPGLHIPGGAVSGVSGVLDDDSGRVGEGAGDSGEGDMTNE